LVTHIAPRGTVDWRGRLEEVQDLQLVGGLQEDMAGAEIDVWPGETNELTTLWQVSVGRDGIVPCCSRCVGLLLVTMSLGTS